MNNQLLRQHVIKLKCSDIVCLCETHLCYDEVIFVEGYSWFGHNRQLRNVRSIRGSGGVGILVKNSIVTHFDISVFDKSIDGILGILLVHRASNISIVLFVCYLPPTTSTWGRDSDSFFAHLLSQIYLCSDHDHIILCGDFNARVCNVCDTIGEIDPNMTVRQNIDSVKSGHCESFLEFMKDSRTCIINGRVTPHLDDFTCVSTRGKYVVDYFLTTHKAS